jgi:hypothetical protein
MNLKEVGVIWVCQDCVLHYCNGECAGCHSDYGHDMEPLGLVKDLRYIAEGMTLETHLESCDERVGSPCDCEYSSYSTSSCEGCGSTLHGGRHAMTLFEHIRTL